MKKLWVLMLTVVLAAAFCGCSLESMLEPDSDDQTIVNGTTTGNLLNYGFAVKDADGLLFLYTGDGSYAYGSLVRSNPDTGESSLVLEQGGLYMSIVDGSLYYCRKDGVYVMPLSTQEPSLLLQADVSQLQIYDGRMYFIEDGKIGCVTLAGASADFAQIQDAGCLNVYGGALYYIDTNSGRICKAGLDGADAGVVYDKSVDMFYIIDDVVYFIDSADGYIKRMTLDSQNLETVVAYRCSGFNVNRQGMYYTREVDGKSVCCNAGADGYQEHVITDFGESAWHVACMWDDTALVIRQEDLAGMQ